MSNPDSLVVAGLAAESLERRGLVACGRRQNGITRVDFWTPDGHAFHHELPPTPSVEEVVATCLAMAGITARPDRALS